MKVGMSKLNEKKVRSGQGRSQGRVRANYRRLHKKTHLCDAILVFLNCRRLRKTTHLGDAILVFLNCRRLRKTTHLCDAILFFLNCRRLHTSAMPFWVWVTKKSIAGFRILCEGCSILRSPY